MKEKRPVRRSRFPASVNGRTESKYLTISDADRPLELSSGGSLPEATLSYETYGKLNPTRDNAVLLFHALTGSQHAAGFNPAVEGVGDLWSKDCHEGWWNRFIGPGKALDTDQYLVICANYVGGCYGSTGPASIDPRTSLPYGPIFPRISFSDIVDSQIRLLDHLGIETAHAVIGSSTGGQLSLNFAVRYPDRVKNVVLIATGMETTPRQKILIFEQIYAVENDHNFQGGNYFGKNTPDSGMAHARIISHKTFVAPDLLETRVNPDSPHAEKSFGWYQFNHDLEAYMLHQGEKFARRFDANSYLRILDAWSSFNLLAETGTSDYTELFSRCRGQRHLIFSIDSDSCYFPEEQKRIESELKKARVPTTRITVHSEKGHDSFLLEPEFYSPHIRYALG